MYKSQDNYIVKNVTVGDINLAFYGASIKEDKLGGAYGQRTGFAWNA
jgi:hypothetical protein